MKVGLVSITNDPIKTITDIASVSYGREQANNPAGLFKFLVENAHFSPLEFVEMTFKVEGISRACLAQLTRYRHASFNVRSQRYCDESEFDFVVPKSIYDNYEALGMFNEFMLNANNCYNKLVEAGIPKEDARYVLPNATETTLYVKMSLRGFMHLYRQRVRDKGAQSEIKNLVLDMFGVLPIDLQVILADLEKYFE